MNSECTTDWEALTKRNIGKYIYHYTTTEVFLQHILSTKKLKLSPLIGTNDPYEFRIWRTAGNASGLLNENRHKLIDDLIQETTKLQQNTALISFCSDDPDRKIKKCELFGRGFADPQMWAHYANRHKGICLVFDKKLLVQIVKQSLKTSTLHIFDDDVTYKNMANAGKNGEFRFNLDQAMIIGAEKYLDEHITAHKKDLFFRKDEAWKNECEFRIIVIGKAQNNFYVDISKAICGVVFGCEYPYRSDTDYLTIK